MIKESYVYAALPNKTHYIFQSDGDNGKITKMVIFSNVGKRLWNLGFGDLDGFDIDDSVVSNNNDVVKVISTVTKIAYDFSENFPFRRLQIKPVDEKRRRLYNHVFRRNYEAINTHFLIIGINGHKRETYSPENYYQHFEINRKLEQ